MVSPMTIAVAPVIVAVVAPTPFEYLDRAQSTVIAIVPIEEPVPVRVVPHSHLPEPMVAIPSVAPTHSEHRDRVVCGRVVVTRICFDDPPIGIGTLISHDDVSGHWTLFNANVGDDALCLGGIREGQRSEGR